MNAMDFYFSKKYDIKWDIFISWSNDDINEIDKKMCLYRLFSNLFMNEGHLAYNIIQSSLQTKPIAFIWSVCLSFPFNICFFAKVFNLISLAKHVNVSVCKKYNQKRCFFYIGVSKASGTTLNYNLYQRKIKKGKESHSRDFLILLKS